TRDQAGRDNRDAGLPAGASTDGGSGDRRSGDGEYRERTRSGDSRDARRSGDGVSRGCVGERRSPRLSRCASLRFSLCGRVIRSRFPCYRRPQRDAYYLLKERLTGTTVRVITDDKLLTQTFWNNWHG